MSEKIDLAFVDRADIKQYIGPPSTEAIFGIYQSCLEELMKVQLAVVDYHIIIVAQIIVVYHRLEVIVD